MADLCRAVAEASPLAMASVERSSHTLAYVNPALCHLLKKTSAELTGKVISDVVPGSEDCLWLLDRVYRSGKAEVHIVEELSALHPFCWSYAMWPVLSAGAIVGVIVQVTESTPFHQQVAAMNQALPLGSVRQHELTATAEKTNAQLRVEISECKHAGEKMQRANKDLGLFAYAASHDLQEPLRAVTAFSQLLARKLDAHLDPEAEGFLQHIVDGNKRMLALINDLLAYAQAGEERQGVKEPVECGKALEVAVANLTLLIEETRAEITSDPLPVVNADLLHLARVFQNLIGNALKYRNSYGSPLIHIQADIRGGEWVISVRDNGIGFEPQQAERIFGIFKRLHKEEYAGTGIGLAIARKIVERHGGSIWAVGEEGKGATFSFTLPIKAGETVRAASAS